MKHFRRTLLRVMLWSLAIAAVLGVLAILTGSHETAWRVVGTAVATAVAAALMMPASLLMDRAAGRSAGQVGMAAVITEYLMCIALIWVRFPYYNSWDFELSVWLTMLFTFLVTPPAMFYLRAFHYPGGWLAGLTGVATAAGVLLLLVAGSWTHPLTPSYEVAEHLMETGSVLAACGFLATLALGGWTRADRRHWRWLGVAASLLALGMSVIWIWANLHQGSTLLAAIFALAAVIGYANVTLLIPLTPGQVWLRWVAIVAANFAAWLPVGMVWQDDGYFDRLYSPGSEWMARGAGAAAFVVGCCSLAMLILLRLNRRPDLEGSDAALTNIELSCPRCHKKQTLPLGEARCTGCELRIFTRIEEPTCPKCGYLLYKLTGATCPECGTRIRDQPLIAIV